MHSDEEVEQLLDTSSDADELEMDDGHWSDSSVESVGKDNVYTLEEQKDILKSTLETAAATLKTMSSQAKETMTMAKKLKSKRVQLVPDLVKSTSYAIHREVVELNLEAQKSAKLISNLLAKLATAQPTEELEELPNEDPPPQQPDKEIPSTDVQLLVDTIRKQNNQNAVLENRLQQMQDEYMLAKDQIRELQLAMKHHRGNDSLELTKDFDMKSTSTKKYEQRIDDVTASVHLLEEENRQLKVEIKDLHSEIRNRDKNLKTITSTLEKQFDEERRETLRVCKAEVEAIIIQKDKEIAQTQLIFDQLKKSLERAHRDQIKELKREALLRTKVLNKRLEDLKHEIEKQRKAAKVDTIRMQETIQAAKMSMVRRTYGESSDEDEHSGGALTSQTPPTPPDSDHEEVHIEEPQSYKEAEEEEEAFLEELDKEQAIVTSTLSELDDLIMESEKLLAKEDTPPPVSYNSSIDDVDDLECY